MLDEIGKQIVELLKQKLVDEDLVVTGNLKNSVHYVVGTNQVEIWADEYAKFVDSGSKPHYVGTEGVKKIIEWASIRGVNPWGVITNIRLYGTKPHPYLDSLVDPITTIVNEQTEIFVKYETQKIYQQLRDAFNKQ